jgi:SAM-dependent methyltransferase
MPPLVGALDKTIGEWQGYAEDDPLFAVASWPDKARGQWGEDDFYALGRYDWQDFAAQWSSYTSLGGTCLELGCGAGRITAPMSEAFDQVLACDVSDAMLHRTEKACAGKSVTTILIDDTRLPVEDGSIDAVFSCHVLQHQETFEVVEGYLHEMHRALRTGGTAMLHLLLGAEQHRCLRTAADIRRRLRMSLGGQHAYIPCVRFYLPARIRGSLDATGFSSLELREFNVKSNHDAHAFWFMTKA